MKLGMRKKHIALGRFLCLGICQEMRFVFLQSNRNGPETFRTGFGPFRKLKRFRNSGTHYTVRFRASLVTPVTVDQIPGLNTLGISAARLDFAPYGEVPPHTHPRATEILVVLEGTLFVGFVTSDPNHTFISKVLNPGDVFVFPIGLIHFQVNIGKTNAVAFSGLSSQNPGVITIASAVFGSNPPINPDFLAKAFQLDVKVVKDLEAKFKMDN